MLWLLLALSGAAPVEGTLRRVVDGNTLVVALKDPKGADAEEVVRIADLECPSVATVSGQLARKRAKALWEPGTTVKLAPAGKKFRRDRQKRTLALVTWPDETGLQALLKDDLCRRVPKK